MVEKISRRGATAGITALLGALGLLAAIAHPPEAVAQPATADTVAERAPAAPDYDRPESWAARPENEGGASAVPPGASPAARLPRIDVFYIHPTTERSKTIWNQDIADRATNGWTDASVVARQASAFNGCCRVFAPRYRQASSRAFAAGPGGEGAKAYDLAYQDISKAFAHYLAHDNHGRPFILAGHSQGGLMVSRLVKGEIEGKPLARRLVAAYVIGINLSESAFGTDYRTVPACATPAQTGCIVQWNSVLKGSNFAGLADGPPLPADKRNLCVNPLTFDRAKPAAGAEAALGAVPGDPGFGPMRPLKAKAVAAVCRNGLLVVDPAPELDLKPLPGGIMHYHDIGLFYADVRANAILRADAFLRARKRQ